MLYTDPNIKQALQPERIFSVLLVECILDAEMLKPQRLKIVVSQTLARHVLNDIRVGIAAKSNCKFAKKVFFFCHAFES